MEFRLFFIATIALALVSSLPWFVSSIMPDLFGGILVLLLATNLFQPSRHNTKSILIDGSLIFLCLTFHQANLLLAIVLTIATFVAALVFHKMRWTRLVGVRAGVLTIVILAAVGANVIVSYVGFASASLTARTPPFLLARSIADGPGRLYLEEACQHGGKQYYLCAHLDKLTNNVNEFLWNPNGAYMSASPKERAAMRSEQIEIVRNAAITYPWMQITSGLKNAWLNLVTIDLSAVRSDLRWGHASGYGALEGKERPAIAVAKQISNFWIYISAILAFAAIVIVVLRRGWLSMFGATLFVIFALIANAAITGVLSGNSSRYQSRVIWVLPLAAFASVMVARRRDENSVGLEG